MKTKKIYVGNVAIGGGESIKIQSMTNTKTQDIQKTVNQINELANAGCDIVRIAVPDVESAKNVFKIKEKSTIPVVCDIHFDYKIALECIAAGADKIRINPGNIGDDYKIKLVAAACKQKGIPIRIGVNGGSLEKEILKKYGHPTEEAMVESAMYHIRLLNRFDFDDICVSLKSSDVKKTVKAYIKMSAEQSYPLHLGVTEAGTEYMGIIKSAAGIGGLLAMGIGDTMRVSLTADPVREIYAAKAILKALGLKNEGINLISCPTCGRCQVNLIEKATEIEKRLEGVNKNLTVAIMGCAVNGPGEAKEADIGIACGNGDALLFKKGQIVKKIKESEIISTLTCEIENI